jgi:hypothetical protein
MKTKQIHFTSGIVLTLFIVPHLYNHLQSLVSIEAHITTMDYLRKVYRNPVVEIVILASVVTQIITGFSLYRKSKIMNMTWFQKLHVQSGLYLAFFFIFHVSAVLLGRTILHLDTNFYFGAAGLNTFPFYIFFFPYYGLAIMSFFSHIASIHEKKMRHYVLSLSPRVQAFIVLAMGILITAFTLYGMTNQFNGISLPSQYNIIVEK